MESEIGIRNGVRHNHIGTKGFKLTGELGPISDEPGWPPKSGNAKHRWADDRDCRVVKESLGMKHFPPSLPERTPTPLSPQDLEVDDSHLVSIARQCLQHAMVEDRVAIDPISLLNGKDAHRLRSHPDFPPR